MGDQDYYPSHDNRDFVYCTDKPVICMFLQKFRKKHINQTFIVMKLKFFLKKQGLKLTLFLSRLQSEE